MAALPPLSIDMGLPALPLIERNLPASAAGAALTLSVFLAGFAVAQLLLGPLSDRIGRRPVLLGGLGLFTVAGIGCALAPSIGALLALRFVQGTGAAAGTVLAFAIVRDVFAGAAMRAKIAYVTMVLSVAPIIAPTLGGFLLPLGGWRAVYGVLALAGVAILAAVVLGLEETRAQQGSRGGWRGLLGGYGPVLRHRASTLYGWSNALNFGCLFAYVSGSPLLLMGSMGASTQLFGLLFAITAGGIMLGAGLNGWLAQRGVPARIPLAAGNYAIIAASVVLVALAAAGHLTLPVMMPLLVVAIGARGLVSPSLFHAALEPLGQHAGAASAFLGFLQMGTGAAAAAIVAALYPVIGANGMFAPMLLFALASTAAWRVAVLSDPRLSDQ